MKMGCVCVCVYGRLFHHYLALLLPLPWRILYPIQAGR